MNPIKKLTLVTVTGLVVVGTGVAHGAKNEDFNQAISARQAIDIAAGLGAWTDSRTGA